MLQNIISLLVKPYFNVHGKAQLVEKYPALYGMHIFNICVRILSHFLTLPTSAPEFSKPRLKFMSYRFCY